MIHIKLVSRIWLAAFWLAMFQSVVSAQTAPAAHADAPVQTYDIHLRWITPTDVMHKMHWDQRPASLPEGVQQVSTDRTHNILCVIATPQGYASLRSIVNYLDVTDRETGMAVTQISFHMALATQAQMGQANPTFLSFPWSPSQNTGEGIVAASLVEDVTGQPASNLLTYLHTLHAVFGSLKTVLMKNALHAICVPMPNGENAGVSLLMQGTPDEDATLTFAPDFASPQQSGQPPISSMQPIVEPLHYDKETVYIFRRFGPASSTRYLLIFIKPTIEILQKP